MSKQAISMGARLLNERAARESLSLVSLIDGALDTREHINANSRAESLSDALRAVRERLATMADALGQGPTEPNTSKPIQWTRDHESKDGRFRVDPIYRGCTTVQGWKLHDTERGRPETFDRLRDAKEAAQWRADSVASQ